ncbi:MAG: two-component regulator propeller domain-containing protein, partial [Bacteroidota bacterium]
MKKIINLLSFILLLSATGVAQTIDPNWKYIRPTNTGLGGDYFRNIEVDQCGNKWTGGYLPFYSEGSVVRFDDSVFTAWSNFEGYIPNAQVYGIAFDQNNGVWVVCNANVNFNEHGGVAHYDGTTWTKWDMTNSPLPTDLMNAIAIDHNNNVWVTFSDFNTSQGGVAKYNGTTWTVYTPSNSGLPTTDVTDIDVDAQNNIWIGSNSGLIKFDGLNWITYTSSNSGISFNQISDVEVDESTNKVYAATTISIDIYDGTNWSHINNSNSPFGNINLTEIDARGDTVIIGSLGGISGAWIYDGSNWTSHISGGHVKDVRIDNDGYFWTCGNGFVEKFDGNNWTTYSSMNTGS